MTDMSFHFAISLEYDGRASGVAGDTACLLTRPGGLLLSGIFTGQPLSERAGVLQHYLQCATSGSLQVTVSEIGGSHGHGLEKWQQKPPLGFRLP